MADEDEAIAAARDRHPAASSPPTPRSYLGAPGRPFAVPDAMDGPKATGKVTLPVNVCWGGTRRSFNLDVRSDRARAYEQVLREGTADDVRRYVDVDLLVDLFGELVLPTAVRDAWASWLTDGGRRRSLGGR